MMNLLSNLNVLALKEMKNTRGGKRFLGTFTAYGWNDPVVQNFLKQGSVACIGTNQQMKANLYQNALGDTICVEW